MNDEIEERRRRYREDRAAACALAPTYERVERPARVDDEIVVDIEAIRFGKHDYEEGRDGARMIVGGDLDPHGVFVGVVTGDVRRFAADGYTYVMHVREVRQRVEPPTGEA